VLPEVLWHAVHELSVRPVWLVGYGLKLLEPWQLVQLL
jgi:hypothetical protein